MMKNIIKLLSSSVVILACAQAPAAMAQTQLTGCAAKRDSLTQQIQQAQNAEHRKGLEKALDEVNAHCTDTKLNKERNKKVIAAQAKVNETERALRKAEAERRPEKKLQERREKNEAAKKKLADAEAKLKQ